MVRQPTYPSVVARILIGLTIGIVVVLFFRLMGALLNLGKRTRERVRWGLVAYATTAFLFVTVFITATLDRQSTSFINNRDFRGFKDIPSGPLGHQMFIYSKMICVIPNIMLMLNNWLADGLLVGSVSNPVA